MSRLLIRDYWGRPSGLLVAPNLRRMWLHGRAFHRCACMSSIRRGVSRRTGGDGRESLRAPWLQSKEFAEFTQALWADFKVVDAKDDPNFPLLVRRVSDTDMSDILLRDVLVAAVAVDDGCSHRFLQADRVNLRRLRQATRESAVIGSPELG